VTLLWQEGWTRWSPEVLSNPSHSVIIKCHGLTWQLATRTRQPLTHYSPAPWVGWGEEWTKSKTCELTQRQFSETSEEGIIIKNMQNKWYTIQILTAQQLMMQPVPEQQSQISWIPAPWTTSIYKLGMMSMVWNNSTGQPGLAAWLCSLPAPAHLLISWTWETGRGPWFLSNN